MSEEKIDLSGFDWERVTDLKDGDLLVLTPGRRMSNSELLHARQAMDLTVKRLGVNLTILVLGDGDTLTVLRRASE